jgi:hypothetical protein
MAHPGTAADVASVRRYLTSHLEHCTHLANATQLAPEDVATPDGT